MEAVLSSAEQDYLKNIYKLEQESGRATTQDLATVMRVKPASVTAMVKHLADSAGGAYVMHRPYHGVELTVRGRAAALEVLRHHRLLELYLAEQLGVPWDRVHEEAERLEHVISEDLEERIAMKLGDPTRDPHGDPIPARDGSMDDDEDAPLATLPVGTRGRVTRVPDGEPRLLQYLGDLGFVPGVSLLVEAVSPFGDVMTIRLGETTHPLGSDIARRVRVLAYPTRDQICPPDAAGTVR